MAPPQEQFRPGGSSRRKSALRTAAVNAVVVLVSLLVTGLFIEIGSWMWVKQFRSPHLTKWEFAATQPPPYRGADYFNEAFLKEAQASVSGHLTDVAELRDYRGEYFNVIGGFRLTTDAPRDPERRVLLFGGSTLFGQEVPDSQTIASHLQRLLNAQGVRWEVRNFGLVGMNAAQQTRILQGVPLRKNDMVVYYHGVNDIYYLVFGGYRDGWVNGVPAFRPVQKLSSLHKTLHRWHERFKDYSYTAQVALDIYQRAEPMTVTDPAELERNVEFAVGQFRSAVRDAAAIARGSGVEFVQFLQPQVFANAQLTPYERALVANPLGTAPGVETAFRKGYPRLREAAAALEREGIAYRDISDALDRRRPGEEVFLDFCHVAHRGNELVAQRMMREYFQARIGR
jgi:hypothetical protein